MHIFLQLAVNQVLLPFKTKTHKQPRKQLINSLINSLINNAILIKTRQHLHMAKEASVTSQLFARLNVLSRDGDYQSALPVVEKILKQAPNDVDALHCKLVYLIHLTKLKEALEIIKRVRSVSKEDGKAKCVFEEAYCLYRMEKYQDSWKLLSKFQVQDSNKVKELRAQLCYRMERFDDSFELLQQVVSELSDDYTEERRANAMAAAAMGQQVGTVTHFDVHDTTFEQCFNSACYYLAINDGTQAEEMLVLAEEKCRASLQEEDYTEEEIEEEVCVIKLQMGCVYLLQGKTESAMQQFSAVLKQKPDDVIQTIVASNNMVVLNKDKDIFDSKKRVKVLSNEPRLVKMTSLQRLSILYNRCLFALHMNQLEQCKQLLKEMSSKHPSSELCLMANLALLNREHKAGNTDKMQTLVDEHLAKSFSVQICLLGAQLPLNAGDLHKVCTILQQIPEVSQYLGIVATLVSFLTQLGAPSEAISVLDSAVEYWEKQQRSSVNDRSLLRVMQANAQYKLVHGENILAAAVLEKLYLHNPQDIQVLAQLIDAYSKFDPSKAEEFSQSLPTFQHSSAINVDALEQAPQYIRKPKDKPTPAVAAKGKPADKDIEPKEKLKKKRKPRLPKNYDPKVAADPERWLPLRERSYYKKGKRKGFVPLGRGAQGSSTASSKLMSQLDASKSSGATARPKDVDQPAVAKPPAQLATSKKKPQAKKKKKGKGW